VALSCGPGPRPFLRCFPATSVNSPSFISRMTHPACDSRAVGQTCAELLALSPVLAEGWACAERSGQSVVFWASNGVPEPDLVAGSRKNRRPSARTAARSNV
jgi:hypothetical protein